MVMPGFQWSHLHQRHCLWLEAGRLLWWSRRTGTGLFKVTGSKGDLPDTTKKSSGKWHHSPTVQLVKRGFREMSKHWAETTVEVNEGIWSKHQFTGPSSVTGECCPTGAQTCPQHLKPLLLPNWIVRVNLIQEWTLPDTSVTQSAVISGHYKASSLCAPLCAPQTIEFSVFPLGLAALSQLQDHFFPCTMVLEESSTHLEWGKCGRRKTGSRCQFSCRSMISLGKSQFGAENTGNISKVLNAEILQSIWITLKLLRCF